MAQAQIHRFRDKVAIYLANGETVYLSPEEAKTIGQALNAAAVDIENNTFVQSTFSTVHIPLSDKRG
ncbi:hypothetical protein uav_009 [Pseudomonas phage UAVern]|uniref:Uncharacterized protein n=1 Tax=Pseudomonas phage UAVern TaxID=2856997 RepID=A0A975YYH4_9CAUD|nr:hypothetical protein uav_009 [Pseudomonas phage UAVern]